MLQSVPQVETFLLPSLFLACMLQYETEQEVKEEIWRVRCKIKRLKHVKEWLLNIKKIFFVSYSTKDDIDCGC